MFRVGVVFACVTILVGRSDSASPDPKALTIDPAALSRARDLVHKLGSLDFADREEAQARLTRMGRLALPALTEAIASHPSAEVRFRSQLILPRAAAADLHARVETFLADTEGKFEHDLPGWSEFQKLTGPNPAARVVFAELLTDPVDRELLFASARPGADLAQSVAGRKQDLYQTRSSRVTESDRRDPSVANVMALLFAESRVSVSVQLTRRPLSPSVLFSTAGVSTAVNDPTEKGRVYRAIVVRWIETRADPVSMNQAINIARTLDLPEGAGVAARLAGHKSATAYIRAQAVMALSRMEAKEHLPILESLLSDDSVVMAGRRPVVDADDIQLRDVALVAALLLTGQDPEDYGFSQRYRAADTVRYTYSNWSIPADKRLAALEWWKVWREKNPGFDKEKKDKLK